MKNLIKKKITIEFRNRTRVKYLVVENATPILRRYENTQKITRMWDTTRHV